MFFAHQYLSRTETYYNDIITNRGNSLLVLQGLFHCLCCAIFELSLRQNHSRPREKPVGSTFNIQNSIPHKSQKTKVATETNRAKEFQRGIAGVPESAKEGARDLSEGSDIGLGQHSQTFEPHTSDQTPLNRVKKRYKAAESSEFSSPLSADY